MRHLDTIWDHDPQFEECSFRQFFYVQGIHCPRIVKVFICLCGVKLMFSDNHIKYLTWRPSCCHSMVLPLPRLSISCWPCTADLILTMNKKFKFYATNVIVSGRVAKDLSSQWIFTSVWKMRNRLNKRERLIISNYTFLICNYCI